MYKRKEVPAGRDMEIGLIYFILYSAHALRDSGNIQKSKQPNGEKTERKNKQVSLTLTDT